MLTGYFLSFVFIVLMAAGIFLFGYAGRKVAASYVAALEIIIGLLLITPIVLLIDGIGLTQLFTKPAAQNWLWLGAASVTGFIGGNYFSVVHLKTAGERNNSLLSPAITACAVLAGALVFAEVLTAIKIAGIVITLAATIIFLLFKTNGNAPLLQKKIAKWSGLATVLCVTLTIIGSVKGTQQIGLSIMHIVWLRLLVALPFALVVFKINFNYSTIATQASVYGAITAGVIIQTIAAAYLWFYCTLEIGIATFQIVIATLPFFVYAADVYLLKRSKPSPLFLATALIAMCGIWLVML